MIYNFVYKNKITGENVYSKVPLDSKDLESIMSIRKVVIDKPIKTKSNKSNKYGK